jgi:hypothetical protein
MLCRRRLSPLVVFLLVACVSPVPADAGGFLKRWFGGRCHRTNAVCRVTRACVATTVASSQARNACEDSSHTVAPPDCVPCMRGNGVGNGDPVHGAAQRERDEDCCERHADDPHAYEACMKLAKLREYACKNGVPFKVHCPGDPPREPLACDCSHCQPNDYGCIYNCQYGCWLRDYCANCRPPQDCSICDR